MNIMNVETKATEYFEDVINTLHNLDTKKIAELTDALLETYNKNGVLYIFGNGGSAATASHICGDFIKGVSFGLEKRFKVVSLNDNIPAIMAIANDIDYADIFVEQLRNFLGGNDLVIGISGSGNSMNVVKALNYAKEKGVATVAICGYDGGKIKEIADIVIQAKISDMEVSEDVHLIVFHCIKKILLEKLTLN